MPTSWIYKLRRPELEQVANERQITTEGRTVEEIRREVVESLRQERPTATAEQQSTVEPTTTEQPKDKSETKSETEQFSDAMDSGVPPLAPATLWNISFDTEDDPVFFLEQLEQWNSLNAKRESPLAILPRVFRGRVLHWFHNNNQEWKQWTDFTEDFRSFYFPVDFERNLLENIIARKQGSQEKFTDYLTDLETLMRRYGKLNEEDKLNRIYQNMDVEYRCYVKRQDFRNIKQLRLLAGEYEVIQHEKSQTTQGGQYQLTRPQQATYRAYTMQDTRRADNRMYAGIKIRNVTHKALIDTGSTNSYLTAEAYNQCKEAAFPEIKTQHQIKLADGSTRTIDKTIVAEIEIEGKRIKHQVHLLPTAEYNIIGMDIIRRVGGQIVWQENTEPVTSKVKEDVTIYTVPPETLTRIEQRQQERRLEEEFRKCNESPKGKENKVARELSRNPICAAIKQSGRSWYTAKWAEVIRQGGEKEDYRIKEQKMYKKISRPAYGVKIDTLSDWKLCIEPGEQQTVLDQSHDSPSAGHLGTAKTLKRIAQRYYWPGMHRDVRTHVRTCNICQKNKTQQAKTPGVMHRQDQSKQEIYTLARQNQNRAAQRQKHHYDLTRRPWRPRLDMQVVKREHRLSKAEKSFCAKLAPKYSGPYEIIREESPVIFKLRDQNNRRQTATAHVKDMKQYYSGTGDNSNIQIQT